MMGTLKAMKEADRIFEEKQKMKAQKIKADGRNAHEFNATEMVMLKLSPPHHYMIHSPF